MIRSLRSRLLLGTTLTFLVILTLLGLAVDAAVRRTLIAEFDGALLAKDQALSSMVEQHRDHVKFEFDPRDMPEFNPGPRPAYFELWINGALFAKSPSLVQRASLALDLPASRTVQFDNTTLPNGLSGRIALMPFATHVDDEGESSATPEAPALLLVARDTRDLDRTLSTVRWTIFSLSAAAILLSGVVLLVVVAQTVRPVKRVARQIEALQETELSHRLSSESVPDELRPIVDRLNDLLARLELAFARERAFASDVAHELRTPIAGLRATLEVCRSRPRDSLVYTAAIDRSLHMIGSMQTVIENLLLLARAESGQLPAALAETDLTGLIQEMWSAFAPQAEAARVTVRWQMPETCVAACDASKLRIVLANLFDNAVSYTNPAGIIEIALIESAGRVEFRIANTGSHILPRDVPHLFERFWRKDQARSQTGVHAGLGLSLCQRLLALFGAAIHVAAEQDQFVVLFQLPKIPSPSALTP